MRTDFNTYFSNLESAGKLPTFTAVPFDICSVGRTVQEVAEAFLQAEYDKGIVYFYDNHDGNYYHCSVKDRAYRHMISFQDIRASLFVYIFWQQIGSYVSISQSDLDACWSLVDALIISGEVENFQWNK
ncbi:MAG: hypothetical protein IJG38_03820 [Thermoguttaceae bacterium]|nr:hypothetical protein [Thermoguttaceae bacterium]